MRWTGWRESDGNAVLLLSGQVSAEGRPDKVLHPHHWTAATIASEHIIVDQ